MLCPYCQQPVDRFEPGSDDAPGLRCPRCGEGGVPVLYPEGYDQHPAVPICIFGPTGHGKTVYIESLLTQLERTIRWPNFSCQWMDQAGMRATRQRLELLRTHGQLPDATAAVFPRPQVVRLRNVPQVGGCQLLFYDTSGETFGDAELLRDRGRYVRSSPAVLWLVSLSELEYPEQLSDLMTVYAEAMIGMGGDPRRQTLVVVLTKGDLFIDRPDLPAAARDFLLDDRLDPAVDGWQRLEAVSAALEEWLQAGEHRNVVNLLRGQFRQVRFSIVSAQGAAAQDQVLQMKMMPRGVLAPLFWLWRETLSVVWVDRSDGAAPVPHFSLAAAVAAAPAGATVRLSAVFYTMPERLEIGRPLRIVGPGASSAVIRCEGAGAAVTINVPEGEVALSGVSILHAGNAPADVVQVIRGRAVLQGCTIRGGVARAPHLSGDGVRVTGAGAVELRECVVEHNRGNGVAGGGQARLVVTKTRVEWNGGSGVYAAGASVEVVEADVTDNGQTGIYLAAAVRGKVHNSTCNRNKNSGILVGGDALAELHNNGCHENGMHGIAVKDRAVLAAQGNWCGSNTGAGIAIVGDVTGEVARNNCNANKLNGIALAGQAKPVVSENKCAKNQTSGISYGGSAGGGCARNTCSRNLRHGIRLSGEASPQVEGNACTSNGGAGFRIEENAAPAFGRDNVTERNAEGDYQPERWGKRGWFR